MKEAIRRRALELGFDACRFTTAEAPASAARFEAWLAAGAHGDMAYLERNAPKRLDPQRVLPGAKCIITLAVSYGERDEAAGTAYSVLVNSTVSRPHPLQHNQEAPTGIQQPPSGFVARYARHQDYHHVLQQPLRDLTGYLDSLAPGRNRSLWYADTGPILERDLAQRSGLGFVGKHTNLINRHLGNWLLLAEILTTLPLEPDAPERNRCGSCARCIAACPTHAIPAPFELDARRCISYLTIELKGPIPVHLRPAIGNRIFGCDDCLAACPWNRFAHEGRLMKAFARPELGAPDLLGLLALDEPGFRALFAGTPMLRAKRRGLLRNVCVALGNVGDASALPALEKAAQDSEPLIAEHARWAIERISLRQPGRRSFPTGGFQATHSAPGRVTA